MTSSFEPSAWDGLPSSVISDCLDRFQVMDSAIRSLTHQRMVGPAFTVETMAGENSTIHRAVYNAPAGSVLAIDADGYDQRAVWGEILTVAAKHGGIAGVVIDGAVRDIDAIRERSYPVFARAVCAAGPHKGWRGRIGTTIQCGGVVVSPGDILVCDEDGVVVVPREGAEEIAAVARERLALESSWIERVDAGETTLEIVGDLPGSEDKSRN